MNWICVEILQRGYDSVVKVEQSQNIFPRLFVTILHISFIITRIRSK